MWLSINTHDPLQWGTHTLTATQSGLTITATITTVTYTTGDNTPPTTCNNPGQPRPFTHNSKLTDHSPTGCDHTYTTINTPGDKTSRYPITATTTWHITWTTTDHQHGTYTLNLTSNPTTNPTNHISQLHTTLTTPPTHK
jgi:hypothetical protein